VVRPNNDPSRRYTVLRDHFAELSCGVLSWWAYGNWTKGTTVFPWLCRCLLVLALLQGTSVPVGAQWANFDRDSVERLMDPTVFDTVQLGRYQKIAGTWMLSSKMQPYLEQVDTLTKVLMDHGDEQVRRYAMASRSSYFYYLAYRSKFQRDFRTALRMFDQSLSMHPSNHDPRVRAGLQQRRGHSIPRGRCARPGHPRAACRHRTPEGGRGYQRRTTHQALDTAGRCLCGPG
jgi:hypothetical protein